MSLAVRLLPDGSVAVKSTPSAPERRYATLPAALLAELEPAERERVLRHHQHATRAAVRTSWRHFGERSGG